MNPSSDPNIKYSVEDSVFTLQIDRPEKKNALTPTMYKALGEGIQLADCDDSIHVILITGTEDCFTSGNDVHGFVDNQDLEGERPSLVFMHAISCVEKPVVAAVNGLAIGIGTTLLAHCDLVYASEDTFLQLPFTRLGVCPELASSLLLPQYMGHQRAAELLMLGDRFTAEKAREYGLVNEVLPAGECLAVARAKAKELASLPNGALRVTKNLMKQRFENELPTTIDTELREFSKLLKTPEAQEIVQAFLNRKKTS